MTVESKALLEVRQGAPNSHNKVTYSVCEPGEYW